MILPPRFSRELADRVPGAELRIVEDAGHGYVREHPDVFRQMCLNLVSARPHHV